MQKHAYADRIISQVAQGRVSHFYEWKIQVQVLTWLSVNQHMHIRAFFAKINRIYHHVAGGTPESHPIVQDLQAMTNLAESWMLQILDMRMGFPSPSRNVVFDYNFSPTCKMYKINNKKTNK